MLSKTGPAAIVLTALFAFAGAGFWLHAILYTGRLAPRQAVEAPVHGADTLQSAFVSVAQRVRPAVVHIGTVQVARSRRPPALPGPFADDALLKDFFDQFFGPRGGPGRREE